MLIFNCRNRCAVKGAGCQRVQAPSGPYNAGPETVIAGADLTVTQGRPLTMERDERTSSIGPTGIMAMACRHRRPDAYTGSPSGDRSADQLAARERQAGPCGVTERPAYQ